MIHSQRTNQRAGYYIFRSNIQPCFWIIILPSQKYGGLGRHTCVLLMFVAFGYTDVRFCAQMGGIFIVFQYGIYGLGLIALIVTLYLFPVIAAFENTLWNQIKSAFYFAVHNIRSLMVILFCSVFPMVMTYMELYRKKLCQAGKTGPPQTRRPFVYSYRSSRK